MRVEDAKLEEEDRYMMPDTPSREGKPERMWNSKMKNDAWCSTAQEEEVGKFSVETFTGCGVCW